MLRRFKFGLLSLAAAGLLTFGLSHPAHANLLVSVQNLPQGSDGTNNTVHFSYSAGGFTANGTAVGVGSGFFPANVAGIDLSSITVSSNTAGTVKILVSENGLTAPIGTGTIKNSITGSFLFGSGTFSLVSYGDNTNSNSSTTPVGTATPAVTTFGGSSSVAFTATGTGSPPAYALYQVLTFTFAAGGGTASASTDSTTSFAAVPEPSSMAIAGLGALGMIGYGLRRRKALGA